ncbi:diacylglycerol kinase family lipid kinase [Paenibacillus sp. HN-1]|uniref:diacylglycerol/lipid kinase family protein n=1 Tax=Paenibacillus TaxID=44249 RepID=UPI001CA7DDE5|nr:MULTISPECIES: diacylglycerol kinase family protein [Paenibacillus]MBY9079956.1 diacylglycerol kinase family lipid kinase [Paenibacillus sp. CGMCC 1.18879]MBY9084598.1 diacylglycerol kinase family lipid kinase [Paenibacillus sinensis]
MYLFVINPRSGGGMGARAWRRAEEYLRERQVKYEALFTGSPGGAGREVELALSRPESWTACVVVGGDGTIHSVLPALRAKGVPLGIIPAGSGNDTARGFGVPIQTEAALDVILGGSKTGADLLVGAGPEEGEAATLTSVACGFDAQVAVNVNAGWYKPLCNALHAGRLAYLIGILHTLITYKPGRAAIVCDGRERAFENVWLASVCNLPSYGGGLRIAPQAKSDDGLLDVCVVHGCSRLQVLRLFPTLLKGSHVSLPFVTMLRGARAAVSFDGSRPAIADGEDLGGASPNVRCEPGALTVLVPHPAGT